LKLFLALNSHMEFIVRRLPKIGRLRRQYIEELVSLVPVHPITSQTGWLVGKIEGQEAAKGNVLPFHPSKTYFLARFDLTGAATAGSPTAAGVSGAPGTFIVSKTWL